nr:hypothetical protein DM860_004209 [Ipomoea trifida]
MVPLPSSSMPMRYFFIISYLMIFSPSSLSHIKVVKGGILHIPIPFPFPHNNMPRSSEMQHCWGSMDNDMASCIVEANAFLGKGSDLLRHGPLKLSTTCCMAFNEMSDRCANEGFAFKVFVPPLVKEYCGFS